MDNAPESLSPTQRHVLLVLADYVNDETHSAYPSIASLCARTGLSVRAVRQSLRVLEDHGIIATTIKGARGSGERPIPQDRRPNLYRWTASLLVRGERRASRDTNEGNVVPPRGERSASREGNVVPGNHNKNHKKNSSSYSDSGTVLELAVVEAVREKIPDAASWIGSKARPALDRGWLPTEIAQEILKEPIENARSVSAILGHRINELGTRDPKRKPLKPTWCGNCDKETRLIAIDERTLARCKSCNPLVLGTSA